LWRDFARALELTATGEEVIKEHDLASALRNIPTISADAGEENLSEVPKLPGHLGV